MTATTLGFTGFEAGEVTHWAAGQNSTVLVGSYSVEVDVVAGNPAFPFYGPGFTSRSDFISTTRVMALCRFRAPSTFYDEIVGLWEVSGPGLNLSRRLVLRKDTGGDARKLMLVDKDQNNIAIGLTTLVGGDDYLLRIDTQLGKDVVYLYDLDGGSPSWTTEIDVDDWGDLVTPFTFFRFGTSLGKTLPTSGGPHFFDECAVLDMEGSTPSTDSLGSITTRLLLPTGVSSANNDFTGASADVDEFPNDGDTTHDEGGTVGDKQGYDVTDATGSEAPLAMQIIGYGKRSGGSFGEDLDYQFGFYRPSTATFDWSSTVEDKQTAYRRWGASPTEGGVTAFTIWDQFDGSPWTSPITDEIEVTVEVMKADNSAKLRITNIGVEYYVAGSVSSPADFPDAPTRTGTGVDDVSISVL